MPPKRYSLRGIGHEKQAAGVLAVVPGVAGPGLAGAQVRRRQRNALETQLRHAVETENFEEAARLRDQLRSLPQA